MSRATACPAHFDREARATWRTALAELQARGLWTDATRPLLQAYCEAVRAGELARTRIAWRADRFDEARAFFGKGSTGQVTPHADLAIARAAESDARAAADQLCISPAARIRAGLVPVDERDPLDAELERLLGGDGR